jgi:hypothetical protein
MIKIIDYLFYRISYPYIEKYKDKQGHIYGVGVVAVMQLMHIYTILLIVALISKNFDIAFFEASRNVNYIHSWKTIPTLIVVLLNALYLNKKRYNELNTYWANENKQKRHKRGWLISVYIFSNILLTVTLAIYRSHLH